MVNHSGIQEGAVELEHPESMTLMMPLAATAAIGPNSQHQIPSSLSKV